MNGNSPNGVNGNVIKLHETAVDMLADLMQRYPSQQCIVITFPNNGNDVAIDYAASAMQIATAAARLLHLVNSAIEMDSD